MMSLFAFKAVWASMTSFLSAIPLKVYLALGALLIAFVTLWVIWGHYKDLQTDLIVTKGQLSIERMAREQAQVTIQVMKDREEQSIANLNELEAQKAAVEVEWLDAMDKLEEIQGDLDEAADIERPDNKPLPGEHLVDQLNRLNGSVNRMLRQGEAPVIHGDNPGTADSSPGKTP